MRLPKVAAIATLLSITRTSCTKRGKPDDLKDGAGSSPTPAVLLNFNGYVRSSSIMVGQFSLPSSVTVDDYYKWYSRPVPRITPQVAEIFSRIFEPKIKALREDLPVYFGKTAFIGDESRVMTDMFSDRLEVILDEIRSSPELAGADAPISGLTQIALFMALPPFWSSNRILTGYYPQELVPIVHRIKQKQEGRKRRKVACEMAEREGPKQDSTPASALLSVTTAIRSSQENWSMPSDDGLLSILCETGPYIWAARLTCKKWRSVANPLSIVSVLGFGKAFKMLSGRLTFDELSPRLSLLAGLALEEFNRTRDTSSSKDAMSLSGETTSAASAGKWRGIVDGLREMVQFISPIYALHWYRVALLKVPRLAEMIEDSVFALFLHTRDDTLSSILLEHVLHEHAISDQYLLWNRNNKRICYHMLRKYLEKYPQAARGYPLPAADASNAWQDFQGL